MPPHSWTTPEQDAFIHGYYDEFMKSQASRNYSNFWPPFFERWFEKFSEEAVVFPNLPVGTKLNSVQVTQLGKAIDNRKEQLRNKLRNNWGASKKTRKAKDVDVKSCSTLISELMRAREPRSRKPQLIEVYLSLYYDDRVKPVIEGMADVQKDEAIVAATSDRRKAARLSPNLTTMMSKARELYKNESAEIKEKVEGRWEEIMAEREQSPSEDKAGSQTTQYYIDKLGPTLGHFFKGLQELTGWSFTVLMGGPSPETGGRIEACSIHVGTTGLGHTFDQAHPNFTSGIMQPYKAFLDKVGSTSQGEVPNESGLAEALLLAEVPTEPQLQLIKPGDLDDEAKPSSMGAVASVECTVVSEVPTVPELPVAEVPTECSLRLTNPCDSIMLPDLGPPNAQLTDRNDNFVFDFGDPTAVKALDDFLARYGPSELSNVQSQANVSVVAQSTPPVITHSQGSDSPRPVIVEPKLPIQTEASITLPPVVAQPTPPVVARSDFPVVQPTPPIQSGASAVLQPVVAQSPPPVQTEASVASQPVVAQTPPVVAQSNFPIVQPTPPIQSKANVALQPVVAQPPPPVQTEASVALQPVVAQPAPPVIAQPHFPAVVQPTLPIQTQTDASVPLQPIVAQPALPVIAQPHFPAVVSLTPLESNPPPPVVAQPILPVIQTPQTQGSNPLQPVTAQPTHPTVQSHENNAENNAPQPVTAQPLPPVTQSQVSNGNVSPHIPDQPPSFIPLTIQSQPINMEISVTSQVTGGKRTRQPSKRNQVSNSIGMDAMPSKKRPAAANGGHAGKKKKTK